MPVRKTEVSTLYAGTVVEEGECVFIAKAEGGSNRYDKIVAMIEESEKLKSSTENRALVLADKLVPWCLGATVVTYLLTRNATRAISCLIDVYKRQVLSSTSSCKRQLSTGSTLWLFAA